MMPDLSKLGTMPGFGIQIPGAANSNGGAAGDNGGAGDAGAGAGAGAPVPGADGGGNPQPKIELIPKGNEGGAAAAGDGAGELKPGDPPKINETEILNSIFGEGHSYKSLEEIKAIIGERPKEAQRLQQMQQELLSLKPELEKHKGRTALMESPEFIAATKFAHFKKELGIGDYGSYMKLESFDPEKISDIDALVLHDFIKNGDKGRLRDEIEHQYRLGDYASEVFDEESGDKKKVEDVHDRRAMEREAAIAKRELMDMKGKISSYKPEFEAKTVNTEEIQKQWKSVDAVGKMLPFFKEIKAPTFEKKFGDIDLKVDASYQFTTEDIAKIKERLDNRINSIDVPLTEENVNALYVEEMLLAEREKRDQLFAIQADKIVAAIDMALKAKYSNFRGLDAVPDRSAAAVQNKRPENSMSIEEMAKQVRMARRGA